MSPFIWKPQFHVVCACALHMCTCFCMCEQVWRPEVDAECPPLSLHILFSKKMSLTKPKANPLAPVADRWSPGIWLFLCPNTKEACMYTKDKVYGTKGQCLMLSSGFHMHLQSPPEAPIHSWTCMHIHKHTHTQSKVHYFMCIEEAILLGVQALMPLDWHLCSGLWKLVWNCILGWIKIYPPQVIFAILKLTKLKPTMSPSG